MSLCREFTELSPEQQRRVVETALGIYINNILASRDPSSIYIAKAILDRARERLGRLPSALEDLRKRLSLYIDYLQTAEELNREISDVQRAIEAGNYDVDLSRLKRLVSELEFKLRGLEENGVLSESDVDRLYRSLDTVKDFIEFIPLAKAFNALAEKINEVFKKISKLSTETVDLSVASKRFLDYSMELDNLISDLRKLREAVTGFSPRSDVYRKQKERLLQAVESAITSVKGVRELFKNLGELYFSLNQLADLIKRYGEGTNLLANPSYRTRLITAIQNVLERARALKQLAEARLGISIHPAVGTELIRSIDEVATR